jgi:hypothetical protein
MEKRGPDLLSPVLDAPENNGDGSGWVYSMHVGEAGGGDKVV